MAGEDGRVRDVDVRKRGALGLGMEAGGRGARLASCGRQADSGVDYDLEPMPPVHIPLPENSVPMGDWMRINGDGIYGSSAWKVFGEGADGVMNVLPGGSIGRWQAEHPFHTTDMRFTKGKDGALYAWCMTVPAAGEKLSIRSLGSASGLMEGKIASVELLGADTQVEWSQGDGALEIVYPDSAKLNTAVGFRIVCE